jgi:signal transduction histidine kinase
MSSINLIYSFRVRLLLVLATLLIATLGVQYYLNRRADQKQATLNLHAQEESARIIAEQEQALAAAFRLGVMSISKNDSLIELRDRSNQPLLEEQAGRVTNILVVDSMGHVIDSLNPRYTPIKQPDGSLQYFNLHDVPLPRLINPGLQADDGDVRQFAQASATMFPPEMRAGAPRAFSFPVDTTDGRFYVIIALGTASAPSGQLNRASLRPLVYTVGIFLGATLITAFLVWRFTQPIKDLSEAARRVAAGDFAFRVPAERRDEMGELASGFNEMIAKLDRSRIIEAKLNQVERSAVVGRLASAIAHEIRNPLNYINLTLDHLRTALAPEESKKRATFERLAVQLKAEVTRINTRISEFLNYTRPAKLDLRPLDLRAQAEDALHLVEVQAAENGIQTHIEQKGTVPPVIGDAESLRSVLTNLFINGLQAMDGGRGQLSVTISAEDSGRRARVDVTDTGRGIAPEHLSQLFEPYFSTKETGTGLGLAIVKKAIDDHGGTIQVQSKLNAGTTFTITLPTKQNGEKK